MRKTFLWIFAFVLIAIVVRGAILIVNARSVEASPSSSRMTAEVYLQDKPLHLELALTDAERQQGLSGRDSLADDGGMLFVFTQPSIYPFWMKEMKFPLDLIWLRDGVVVDVVELSPPNRLSYPATHTPTQTADMVLELTAGGAERYGISEGVLLPEIKQLRLGL